MDTDFEDDADGGHCDGLSHAFNPKANFICCRFVVPTTTPIPTTPTADETTLTSVETTESPPPPTEPPTTTTKKPSVSPFNIASNTNKILSSIQHLLSGGRMRPSVSGNKYGPQVGADGGIYNDKSLLNLILLGLNETLKMAPPAISN